jgi:hypothetical protein
MPIEMRTHGLDWRKRVRDVQVFVALVTPAWHTDRLTQEQYRYAKELGKPIVLLVQQGTALPVDADAHCWCVWTTPKDLTALLRTIEQQGLPGLA